MSRGNLLLAALVVVLFGGVGGVLGGYGYGYGHAGIAVLAGSLIVVFAAARLRLL